MRVKPNPKHKVLPNLSLKGKDLMTRVNNRSIDLSTRGNFYGDNPEMFRAKLLAKPELVAAAKKNAEQIANIKKKLENGSTKP